MCGLSKSLGDIAGGVAGFMIGGPAGAAAGAGLMDVAGGGSIESAALAAGGGYLGGAYLPGMFGAGTAAGAGGLSYLGPGGAAGALGAGTSPFDAATTMSGLAYGGIGGGGLGTAASMLNIGGGLYGLYAANQMQQMARTAFGQANPFGPYRAQYAQQLAELSANPNLITTYPGYQFGMQQGTQAVERAMAGQGYTGSGNEAIALQRYGQEYAGQMLSAEEARLANLAGAGMAPSYGTAMSGYGAGIDVASQSLAALGYGMRRF